VTEDPGGRRSQQGARPFASDPSKKRRARRPYKPRSRPDPYLVYPPFRA
jgi:hypothetical protein